MSEEPIGVENQVLPEKVSLKPVENLFVLVHPSFLINNPHHPDSTTFGRSYEEQTRRVQKNARERFTPQSAGDVLLLMPHEHPSLDSFRRSKVGKKQDPERRDWTDLYRAIKNGSANPDNIILIGNLSSTFPKWHEPSLQKAKAASEREISGSLKSHGFVLSPNTVITVGGEYLDLCVSETVEKLLLLPEITEVRIAKDMTFDSVYGNQTHIDNQKINFSKEMVDIFKEVHSRRGYRLKEDERYYYIARSTD